MYFKDLKQGYPVYILDKDRMEFTTEKVASVSLPHVDAKVTSTQMVVDVTTENHTFCMMSDADIAYPQGKVITTDKAHIVREIEAIKSASEQALSQVDRYKETVTKCNDLLASLDPLQKEKQQTEARFSRIEESMSKMMEILQKLA